MADSLRRHLNQLNELSTADLAQRGADATSVTNDIAVYCLQSVSETELAYCSSLLFSEENGITSFLRKTINLSEFELGKENLLNFLEGYIKKVGKGITPYAVEIKEVCLKHFSQDPSSRVKVATFKALIQLLEQRLDASVVEKLNVPKLIEKYFQACMQPTKHSATVRHGIYVIMGTFAEVFPELMMARQEQLLSIYMSVLKSEMISKKSKKPDMPVIAGCLRGLTSYLVNFTQSVEEGSRFAKEIYNYARMAVDPKGNLSQYKVPNAGLHLFAKHAGQFKEYMTNEHEMIYESFFRWVRHHNSDMRKAGLAAMESFLREVSVYLVTRGGDKRDVPIFKAFIRKFRVIIDAKESDTREMTIAIRGYGYFAKPCKMFMKEEDVKFMFSEMMHRSEQIYFVEDVLIEDKVQHLPSFLDAISCIVEELDEVSDNFLASLERLVVVLFENFPRLGKGPKYVCYKAIVKVLFNLASKSAVLKTFLSQIIYQGLIRTCSHPVVIDEVSGVPTSADDDDPQISAPKTSYKDYIVLWEHLLDKTKLKDLNVLVQDLDKRDLVHEMVYDELIQAILRIVNKLDLKSRKSAQSGLEEELLADVATTSSDLSETPTSPTAEEDTMASDPVAGLQPKVPKDFLVFINLVEFCRSVLPKYCPGSFERWIYVFGREIIVFSTRYPVVSGFYKLLEVCMTICRKLKFFKIRAKFTLTIPDLQHLISFILEVITDQCSTFDLFLKTENIKPEKGISQEDLDMDIVDSSDRFSCFVLFRKFMKEVLVRMKQYKDDLLSSCLRLVLSLPHEMIVLDLPSMVPALKTTFKLGLSYIPLAEAGLHALENWTKELPYSVLQPYFKHILPCLDSFLKTSTDANADMSQGEESSTNILRGGGKSARGRKFAIKLGNVNQGMSEGAESPLTKVRIRILRLLGSLGGRTNAWLLSTGATVDPTKAVAWDTEHHLSFAVPFQDMKPNIYLDPFLPRVVELATTSSDRQTKVAACELLHTLVLYMLGKGVTQPEGKKSPMERLWKHVFPALLQLACDVEQVAEQLFKPLLFQLIHWFTNNRKYESPETMALLNALLDGVIHPTDTALRDFSALCVREFLKWSIKQTSEKQLAKSPINIKSLLKRLYSLALHPNASKRLGAALAFNNIYTVFREESTLVDVFVLEILVTYIESLALAHLDDQGLGTQERCIQTIGHLERIIKEKADKLNKDKKDRRVPRGFRKDTSITLSYLIPWLVKHCGKPQTECRHQCMRLVCVFAPLIPGIKSAADWMGKTYQEQQTFFVKRFESGGGGRNGIQNFPKLSDMGTLFSLKDTALWFDFLLAALDCYTWAFGQRLLSPEQLFKVSSESKHRSNLFVGLNFFLSQLAMHGVGSAAECFRTGSKMQVFSPKEIGDYDRIKCTLIVRILNFATVMLQTNVHEALAAGSDEFWNEKLFDLTLSCILEPGLVGFNMGDVEVIENLPKQTGELCKVLSQKLPQKQLQLFKKCLERKIAFGSRCNLFDLLPLPLCGAGESELDHLRLMHLVKGFQLLHSVGLLLPAISTGVGNTSKQLASKLLEAVYEGVRPSSSTTNLIKLSPTSQQLATKLLELAFAIGVQHDLLLNCLMDRGTMALSSGPGGFGIMFYRTFQSSISLHFIKNSSSNIPQVLSNASDQPWLVSAILNGVLDEVTRDRELRTRYGTAVVVAILSSWRYLEGWCTPDAAMDLKQLLLLILRKILKANSKIVVDPKKPSFTGVFQAFLSLLGDKSASLQFKSQMFELLPHFTNLPSEMTSQLRTQLDCVIADHFPLSSTEFMKGSPKYNEYISALDKMLGAFVSSGSLDLLKLLISIVCREAVHTHDQVIEKSLAAFIRRLNSTPDKAKEALDVCFGIFLSERDHRNETRKAVVEKMILLFLLNTTTCTLKQFFCAHIKKIMEFLEAKQSRPSDPLYETQLISKLCCFEMVEVLYSRLGKNDLNTPESAINRSYCADVKTGKELTMAITKLGHATKNEDMRGESIALELRRQLHCAAYNALVALISCTQSELKFYVGFLFTENTTKGQFLLDNLVDCSKKYEFEVELTAPLSRKTQMTSIRMQSRHAPGDDSQNGSQTNSWGQQRRYISSQFLGDSSLSEDVSHYDFSTPIQAYSGPQTIDAAGSSTESTPVNTDQKGELYETMEDVVEMDELNQHECMAKLTALLKHLVQNKISPEPEKGLPPKEMPLWMAALHKKFNAAGTHINVQLFIAKLILNESLTFEPYAKFWMSNLMELIQRIKDEENSSREGINYFIVDIVVVLLSWNNTFIPEDTYGDRHLVGRLLEFLMTKTKHKNRSVFRNNLGIIKTMVELWRDRIQVPTRVIFDNFNNPNPEVKDNAAGIQLLGVVLANGLSPFSRDSGVDETRFFSSLVNNLSHKYKDVHAAAAEVLGMALKYKADSDKEMEGPVHDLVVNKLSTMKSSPDKFITCVHRLQVNFPPIVDKFINQILFLLPTVHGTFKTQCLEIICSRVDHIPNLYRELKVKGLSQMLSYRDEGTQLACLKIVQGLLKQLSASELLFVMPSITVQFKHPSAKCRDLLYDILIWIYDTYRADETFRAEEGAADILSTAKDYLLQGLGDESKDIRLKLRNFWSDETRLPGTTLERLVEVLRAMYSPNTETQYLSYTTNLILHLTSLSPDYQREMFEHPLSECTFQDVSINYSWQQRHYAMTPLFAATQGATMVTSMSQSYDGTMAVDGAPGLRATQTAQFVPTQELGMGGQSQSHDWMNPSSQEPGFDAPKSFSIGTADQSQSSLLFITSKSKASRKSFKAVPKDFGSRRLQPLQTATQTDSQVGSQRDEIMRLKRRFLKDQTDAGAYFAKKEVKRKQFREEALQRQKTARENRVVMYRKYRVGDLPDIQIKHSELIAPLQAVAQCDNTFAKQLFTALFGGIFSQVDEKLTEREAISTTAEIQAAINDMMSGSTAFFPPFISCMEEICYREGKLTMPPAAVSSASLASLQQPIGVMLLEKQLLKNVEEEQRSAKRARGVKAPTESTTTWIEMAKLYRSLGDYDVLRGIFTSQIGTQEITQKALEAEARGDYAQALKLYNKALETSEWPHGDPQQEEEDLWDDSRLQCFANLTQWENLDRFSVANIDENDPPDLDKIWSDTFFQEHYLPFLLYSRLKLQCQGGKDTSLLPFVTRALGNTDRKALLESRHSEKLALLYLLHDDLDRARFYTGNSRQSFLVDWAGLDTMMSDSRSSKLQSLQKIEEMQEFLEFIDKEDNFSGVGPVNKLLDRWSDRYPDAKLHSIGVWDDIVTNRCVYMEKLKRKFGELAAGGSGSESMDLDGEESAISPVKLQDLFVHEEVKLQLRMAETAKAQSNFPVAVKYLREALRAITDDLNGDSHLQLLWTHSYVEVHQKKANTLTAVEAVETALLAIQQLDKQNANRVLEKEPMKGLKHHILRSRSFDIVTRAIALDEGLVLSSLEDEKRASLASLCGCNITASPKKVVSQLMTRSFVALQSAVKALKSDTDDIQVSTESSEAMVKAMMAMVNFCDDALRKKEDNESDAPEIDTKLFPGIVVRYLLKAMSYNSPEARQKFPRLLQLVELYPDTVEAFRRKSSDVPCWMYIGWISQMVALLDKSEGKAVQDILQAIAETYPQALCYPLKISSEQFAFTDDSDGRVNKEAVDRLKELLAIPLLDDFIAALEQLTHPEMAFRDWAENEIKPLLKKKGNTAGIKDCVERIYKDLFNVKQARSRDSSSQTQGAEFGKFRRMFAEAFAKDVEKACGRDGSKLKGLTYGEFMKRIFNPIHEKMILKRRTGSWNAPETLKEYSPWLSNFQASNYTYTLEIPGQYTGRCKPLPEYHVKIAGFDERVRVMSSIRKPKRIIIRGDDEKEHMFLVKGGEDLRQDQRIEQLFDLMNDIMAEDPACSQRNLRLRTYQVIPLTTRIGLIEWMQHTTTLKDFLLDAMTKTERDHLSPPGQKAKMWIDQENWIGKFKGFSAMYKNASRSETEQLFNKRQVMVPWNLLSRAFVQLSASPEAYLTLRSHFARTHGCLCICQYILGIGDRHLSNFMIDMETGGIVGIDFGHAFGSATQFLPVPELIPFRLTRQIVNLTLPLRESGQLQSTMVHTLRALRNNHELLLNTMDVFVKEPSLDWQAFASKQAQAEGLDTDELDKGWYPREKIKVAKRKLEGDNPAHIMSNEVGLNPTVKMQKFQKEAQAVCKGDRNVNLRAKEPASGLSVEMQVACLIDHASDPNILGRTWYGWEPWM